MVMSKFFRVILIFFVLLIGRESCLADILPIQTFKTAKNIEVWLVEDHTSPVVSIILSFEKTTSSSPYTPISLLFRDGLNSGAGLLTPLEMEHFSNETPLRWAIQSGISKNTLLLKTTKEGLSPTLNLWARLVSHPHFQKADLNFIKQKTLNSLSQAEEDLDLLVNLKLLQSIFPNNSFDLDFKKAKKTLESLTPEILEKETSKNFLCDRPKVVVVGDTNKKEISTLLDASFGSLALSPPSSLNKLTPDWASKEIFIEKDIPQSLVEFAQPGLSPNHKDYPKFLLLQYILSGRFYDELRTKRGYIYSISFFESHYKDIALLKGTYSCECRQTKKVLKFIRSEWERLKDFGISQSELTDAKRAFKRAKILNLTSTEAVATEYIDALDFNLAPDSAKTLLEDAEKVTLDEMNQFIQGMLKPDSLTCVLIGSPINSSQ